MDLYGITEDQLPAYLAVIQREQSNRHATGGAGFADETLTGHSVKRVGCLLSDIPDATRGQLVTLQFVPPEDSSIVEISTVGWPQGNPQIGVQVQGRSLTWHYSDSAAEVARVLGVDSADVCLGVIEDDDGIPHHLGRWRVRYPPGAAPSIISYTSSISTFGVRVRRSLFFESDSRVIHKVYCPLPLPTETPLRAGSQVVYDRFNGFWGILSAEPRYLVSPYSQGYSS